MNLLNHVEALSSLSLSLSLSLQSRVGKFLRYFIVDSLSVLMAVINNNMIAPAASSCR